MARIAIIAAAAVAGAAISVATGGLGAFAVGAWAQDIIAGISVGASLGGLVSRIAFPPKGNLQMPLQDLQVSSSADGSPIPFGYGACRFGGQLIWAPKLKFKLEHVNPPGGGGSGMGGGGSNLYVYFADIAIAFGEGPATIRRIWADSKLIYKAPLTGDLPLGDVPPWNPDSIYETDDMVTFNGIETAQNPQGVYVYQAILPVPAGISPPGNSLYWELSSDFPPWQSTGVTYVPGMAVFYQGQIWVASQTPIEGAPTLGGRWKPLQQYYGVPAMYPGDNVQLPDPTVQGAEGVDVTPAFRGLCYAVYEGFPLANFGNRIPNLRAEIIFGEGASSPGSGPGAAPTVVQQSFVQNIEPSNPTVTLPGDSISGNLLIAVARWRPSTGAPPSIDGSGWTPRYISATKGIWYKTAAGGPESATFTYNADFFAFNGDAFLLEVQAPTDGFETGANEGVSATASVEADGVVIDVPLFAGASTTWAAAMFTLNNGGTLSALAVILSDNGFQDPIPTGWADEFPTSARSWSEILTTTV